MSVDRQYLSQYSDPINVKIVLPTDFDMEKMNLKYKYIRVKK
jgi:hypothetical protein